MSQLLSLYSLSMQNTLITVVRRCRLQYLKKNLCNRPGWFHPGPPLSCIDPDCCFALALVQIASLTPVSGEPNFLCMFHWSKLMEKQFLINLVSFNLNCSTRISFKNQDISDEKHQSASQHHMCKTNMGLDNVPMAAVAWFANKNSYTFLRTIIPYTKCIKQLKTHWSTFIITNWQHICVCCMWCHGCHCLALSWVLPVNLKEWLMIQVNDWDVIW